MVYGREVCRKGDGESPDDSNRHHGTEIVDDTSETEHVRVVEYSRRDQRQIPARERVAVVGEGFITQRWNWKTLLLVARNDRGYGQLESHETGVEADTPCCWGCILFESESETQTHRMQKVYEHLEHDPTFSQRTRRYLVGSQDTPTDHHRTTSISRNST